MSLSTIRHDYIFNAKENNLPITLIGCGAIGSRVFMSLIELGLTKITCVDFDHVEPHNLANQAFLNEHIGQKKALALKDLYLKKTGQEPPDTMAFHVDRLPSGAINPSGIVILAVDSVAARKEIAEWLKGNDHVFYIIELGMASTHGHVKTFSPALDQEFLAWWDQLGSDDEPGEVSACGSSLSVGPTASVIANMAVWQLIHLLTNIEAHNKKVEIFLKPTLVAAA